MAQAGYIVNNANAGTLQAAAAAFKTGCSLKNAATLMKRIMVWELEFSCVGALNATTDDQVTEDFSALSAAGAGTSTAATPQPTNNSGDTSVIIGAVNYSAEPTTYGNSFFRKAVNQRSGYTWQVQQGGEIFFPATASIGCGMRFQSGGNYTGTVLNRINYSEI